jgi:NAD(P)-dependent dehydrogenase (short-subunit alcohol dehydrogenase family)
LDVTDLERIRSARDSLLSTVLRTDVLINNAGISATSKEFSTPEVNRVLGELEPDAMMRMFQVNSLAPVMVSQEWIPLLLRSDSPRIVNVSSNRGSLAAKHEGGEYSYCASKAALNMLTKAMAFDLLPMGITMVALHPGWVRTDMGGPMAQINAGEAAHAIIDLIAGLSSEDAGRFLDTAGLDHPW